MAATDRAERQRLFTEVQQIFSEELPAIYFVAPEVFVATSTRVTGARPGLLLLLGAGGVAAAVESGNLDGIIKHGRVLGLKSACRRCAARTPSRRSW